ncbi:MAG: C39 family peptidase [Candidatus Limivivens sp.]|nr:C39 family peptidase [Candidatus Limivivens sp.]
MEKSRKRYQGNAWKAVLGILILSTQVCLAQAAAKETEDSELLKPSTITYSDGVTHHLEEPGASVQTSVELEMKELLQNPELPTGCESVALTSVLNYWGYPIAKTRLVDEYLIFSEDNFACGYVGDPYSDYGAGIYAPGLTDTANAFLEDQGSELEARDISGTDFEKLYDYVEAGYPVIVWNTMYMGEPMGTDSFCEYNGVEYEWFNNEHCVVLMGFHKDSNEVVVNDPLEGILERNADTFEAVYNRLGQQAVLIREK